MAVNITIFALMFIACSLACAAGYWIGDCADHHRPHSQAAEIALDADDAVLFGLVGLLCLDMAAIAWLLFGAA